MKLLCFNDQKSVCHRFDKYCKVILKNETINYKREKSKLIMNEVCFSNLTESEENELYVLDEYAIENDSFSLMGWDIEITDAFIADALKKLPEKKRNIILLYYFLEMSDEEIGKILNVVRSTIFRHRKNSLERIKKYLEEKLNE